jgi:hypothetical protein
MSLVSELLCTRRFGRMDMGHAGSPLTRFSRCRVGGPGVALACPATVRFARCMGKAGQQRMELEEFIRRDAESGDVPAVT